MQKQPSKWLVNVTYTVDVEGCDLRRECTTMIARGAIAPDEEIEQMLQETEPTAHLERAEWLVDERRFGGAGG